MMMYIELHSLSTRLLLFVTLRNLKTPSKHERPFQLANKPKKKANLLAAEYPKTFNLVLVNVKANQVLSCLGKRALSESRQNTWPPVVEPTG